MGGGPILCCAGKGKRAQKKRGLKYRINRAPLGAVEGENGDVVGPECDIFELQQSCRSSFGIFIFILILVRTAGLRITRTPYSTETPLSKGKRGMSGHAICLFFPFLISDTTIPSNGEYTRGGLFVITIGPVFRYAQNYVQHLIAVE